MLPWEYFLVLSLGFLCLISAPIPVIPSLALWTLILGLWSLVHQSLAWLDCLLWAAGLWLLAQLAEYFLQFASARLSHSSSLSAWGAVLGALVGTLGALPLLFWAGPFWGMILGSALGALAGEAIALQNQGQTLNWGHAKNVLWALLINQLGQSLLKTLLMLYLWLYFAWSAWPYS